MNKQKKHTGRKRLVGHVVALELMACMDGLQYSLAVHGKKKKGNDQEEHSGSN